MKRVFFQTLRDKDVTQFYVISEYSEKEHWLIFFYFQYKYCPMDLKDNVVANIMSVIRTFTLVCKRKGSYQRHF